MIYIDLISKRILDLCEERKWSVNQIATLAHLPPSTVNKIVNKNHKDVHMSTVNSIALVFGMTISEFLDYPELNNITLKELDKMKQKNKSGEPL